MLRKKRIQAFLYKYAFKERELRFPLNSVKPDSAQRLHLSNVTTPVAQGNRPSVFKNGKTAGKPQRKISIRIMGP
jgi:hypothetical protein